ncbi:MAG: hypothetical protein RIG67_17805 [Rhodospirillales bacterium]
MEFDLTARFTGDEADLHRLPAYEGTKSLIGLSRSLTLINHYLITGTVRQRAPYTDSVKIFIRPAREACFETVFTFISEIGAISALGGAVAVNVTANLITDGVRTVLSRVTGRPTEPETGELADIERVRPGDLEALVDAVEPAMRQGHTAIGQGSQNIIVIKGDNNVVTFNPRTKDYVNSEILTDEDFIQDVSVGALNVNSGYGRVWFDDLGKTVPFKLDKERTGRTVGALARSLDGYANGEPSDVRVTFRKVNSADGRTKKIIISDAEDLHDD